MTFSFWEFMEVNLYIPLMPVDLQELHDRNVNAIAQEDITFLSKVWDEL
jgi:hypothetical protein